MAISVPHPRIHRPVLDLNRPNVFGLALSAVMPLAVFVVVHGLAQVIGVAALFFSPLGLPASIGAAVHMSSLLLFGAARWMVARQGASGRHAGWWVVGLIAGNIALPFVAVSLDVLGLTFVSFALFLVGLGAMVRVGRVAPRAALVMAPGLVWMGLGAFVGLSLSAGWAPPFAVTNSQGGA